eukprot:GHVL01040352.1.p1 GENE.GHVL01040352.1~~GHVL01040352.1.p1  ORF type:complete len:929 (+),score=159.41 GHVL01040352.1:3-2789(+)
MEPSNGLITEQVVTRPDAPQGGTLSKLLEEGLSFGFPLDWSPLPAIPQATKGYLHDLSFTPSPRYRNPERKSGYDGVLRFGFRKRNALGFVDVIDSKKEAQWDFVNESCYQTINCVRFFKCWTSAIQIQCLAMPFVAVAVPTGGILSSSIGTGSCVGINNADQTAIIRDLPLINIRVDTGPGGALPYEAPSFQIGASTTRRQARGGVKSSAKRLQADTESIIDDDVESRLTAGVGESINAELVEAGTGDIAALESELGKMVEFIRVSPQSCFIGRIHRFQSRAMWECQLTKDDNIQGQRESAEALQYLPRTSCARKLAETVSNPCIQHSVRIAAMMCLLERSLISGSLSDSKELTTFLFDKYTVDTKSLRLPLPHDFIDPGEYTCLVRLIRCLACSRDSKGQSPKEIVDTLFVLLQCHDNDTNWYDDAHYLYELISSFAFLELRSSAEVGYVGISGRRLGVEAVEKSKDDTKRITDEVQQLWSLCHLHLQLEMFHPCESTHHLVTAAVLRAVAMQRMLHEFACTSTAKTDHPFNMFNYLPLKNGVLSNANDRRLAPTVERQAIWSVIWCLAMAHITINMTSSMTSADLVSAWVFVKDPAQVAKLLTTGGGIQSAIQWAAMSHHWLPDNAPHLHLWVWDALYHVLLLIESLHPSVTTAVKCPEKIDPDNTAAQNNQSHVVVEEQMHSQGKIIEMMWHLLTTRRTTINPKGLASPFLDLFRCQISSIFHLITGFSGPKGVFLPEHTQKADVSLRKMLVQQVRGVEEKNWVRRSMIREPTDTRPGGTRVTPDVLDQTEEDIIGLRGLDLTDWKSRANELLEWARRNSPLNWFLFAPLEKTIAENGWDDFPRKNAQEVHNYSEIQRRLREDYYKSPAEFAKELMPPVRLLIKFVKEKKDKKDEKFLHMKQWCTHVKAQIENQLRSMHLTDFS